MKGVYSSPDSLLYRTATQATFPDDTYPGPGPNPNPNPKPNPDPDPNPNPNPNQICQCEKKAGFGGETTGPPASPRRLEPQPARDHAGPVTP